MKPGRSNAEVFLMISSVHTWKEKTCSLKSNPVLKKALNYPGLTTIVTKQIRLFNYQKSNRYFAQITEGLEKLGLEELKELGADDIKPSHRGFYFSADSAVLYRINYCSRLFSRILAPLLRFDCHSSKYLYKTACKIDWPEILNLNSTFAVNANVSHSRIKHSHYASLCLKDAIVDVFREKTGKRPDVNTKDPHVRFNLYIQNNKATIYLDTSGGSLHKRGYRKKTVAAPMQETVAAAIIRLSGWQGEKPLIDPMCGSGTLLCEALMHYCRIPAGYLRKSFGFESLPDFDNKTWQQVKLAADKNIRDLPEDLIMGNDESKSAVAAARTNAEIFPQAKRIRFTVLPYKELTGLEDSTIISNPPYGIRIGAQNNMENFMQELGDFLKQKCKGATAYLYFGNRTLLKSIGLKPSWKKPLISGGLDGRLVKYSMY
jgi:putative N6-adenine-specific DNA methylase